MNWLRRFLAGRYGFDHLGGALLALGLLLAMLGGAAGWEWLELLAFAVLLVAWLRGFSRNYARRRAENSRWLEFSAPYRQKLAGCADRLRQSKTHCFFKCPSCRQQVRVPRGRGKLQITCPKCGTQFIRDT